MPRKNRRKNDEAPYDIVVDIAHPRNRNITMPGLERPLKSEIRAENCSTRPEGALFHIGGVLPQHRLYIDVDGCYIKIVHRLTEDDPKMKAIVAKLKSLGNSERYSPYQFQNLEQDEHHVLKEDAFRTFMWYLRRYADSDPPRVRIVDGARNLPSAQEQLLACDHKKGRVIILSDDQGITTKKDAKPFWQLDERDADGYVEPVEEAVTA